MWVVVDTSKLHGPNWKVPSSSKLKPNIYYFEVPHELIDKVTINAPRGRRKQVWTIQYFKLNMRPQVAPLRDLLVSRAHPKQSSHKHTILCITRARGGGGVLIGILHDVHGLL